MTKLLTMRLNSALCTAFLLAICILPVICRRSRPVEPVDEVEEEEDNFSCPEKFGYFSDSSNCSRYHVCDHGKSSVKTCDDGLVFSTILKTCDWPYNVHCHTADADFAGRTLRLRNNEDINSDNRVDQNAQGANTHRREPLLSPYDDDSYWLGRPETTLLNLGDDDEYPDNYHYEEPKRVSRPKSTPSRQEQPRRQPEARTVEEPSDDDGNTGPWFNSLNFDQIRRTEDKNTQPTMFRRIENGTTITTTTVAPSPPISNNGRGGWRQSQRVRQSTPPTTTSMPQLLPRKALRIGNVDDDVLVTEDLEPQRGRPIEDEREMNVLRRQKEPQESYRLVPTTTRAERPSTVPPQPRHLGSSRRRSNPRTTSAQPTTTTPRPPTSETPRPWNARVQPLTRNSPITNITPRRMNIDDPFKKFERRPVLRDSEDAPTRENFEDDTDDSGLDDSHYFATPLEIRKKGSNSRNEARLNVPIPKDVSNSLDTRRPVKPKAQQVPPKSTRIDNTGIYKAFQNGFNQAIKPTAAGVPHRTLDDDGNTFRVNPSADMEYEDVGNEDEDENVDDTNEGPEDNQSNAKPNKEIVVKYDDEEEESEKKQTRPATPKPQLTNPQPTTTGRTTPTLAPRLTQFVDIVVHNKPAAVNFSPAQPTRSPNSAAKVQVEDLLAKPRKNVNPSLLNFGLVPAISTNNSLLFFPQNISPKQPRHTHSLADNNNNLTTPKKVKVKTTKKNKNKEAKAQKNEPAIASKFHKLLPQKTYHKGTYNRAKRCVPELCQPPNCTCGGVDIPGGFAPTEIPQIVLLTFDDSVNDLNREIYKKLFEQGRKNPNGCPIRSTFYVSHEWTDYSQVQNLYAKGHEMASHTISFGEKFTKDRWLSEVAGQREIMHLYGGVNWEDIRGMRAPFLQTGGNTMFEMLKEANFSYDSSMPVYDIDPPYWPYTLDYAVGHDCMIEPCPTQSIPALWEVGMVMWEDLRGGRCSMADGCFNPDNADGVYEMVKANFNRHYNSNRAPFGAYFHSRWFLTDHNMKGFLRFLDEVLQMKDVYFVTNWQMLQWMQRPTPLSRIKNFEPFGCDDVRERPPLCKAPRTCKVRFRSEIRTLRTCGICPHTYPWTGNNGLDEK